MASAGGGTPPTIESSENRTEADANAGGSLPVVGQDMGATADAGGRNKTEEAQEAQKGARKQQGEAHRAALMEQAEAAAAKLKGLMAELAGTWVSPLAVPGASRGMSGDCERESGVHCSSAELRKGASAASRSAPKLRATAHGSRAKAPDAHGGDDRIFKRTFNTCGGAVGEGTDRSARLRSSSQRSTSKLDARGFAPGCLRLICSH